MRADLNVQMAKAKEPTSMYRWPRPKHSQQSPGVVQNWSALQCSKEKTLNYVVMTMRL